MRCGPVRRSRECLDIAREIRRRSEIPLLLFSYLNPLLRYGFERLAKDAVEAGIDGVLLTDLSVEEAGVTCSSVARSRPRYGLSCGANQHPGAAETRRPVLDGICLPGFAGRRDRRARFAFRYHRAADRSHARPDRICRSRSASASRLRSRPPRSPGTPTPSLIGSAFVRLIEQHRDDPALAQYARGFHEAHRGCDTIIEVMNREQALERLAQCRRQHRRHRRPNSRAAQRTHAGCGRNRPDQAGLRNAHL